MTDSVNDVFGLDAVKLYERYRDFEVEDLAVRITVPDVVQESGERMSAVVSVYELVDEERGRFIATVFRLDSTLPPLAHFNINFERTLSREQRNTITELAKAWWRRRQLWKAPAQPRRRTATPRGR